MDLDNKRTRILSSIYRGYNYKQISESHDCNIIMIIHVCRNVIQSTVNENTSTEFTRILLEQLSIDYNIEDYPELWI